MGGFGSMSYSARHPGLFSAAAGFSGAVDFLHLDRVSALYAFLGNPVAGTPDGPIWGDPVTNYAVWQDHDPGTHVDGLAGLPLGLDILAPFRPLVLLLAHRRDFPWHLVGRRQAELQAGQAGPLGLGRGPGHRAVRPYARDATLSRGDLIPGLVGGAALRLAGRG